MQKLDRFRKFYRGKGYPLAAATLIFVGHVTRLDLLCIVLLALSVACGLLLCHDLRFVAFPAMAGIVTVSAKNYTPADPGYDRFYNPFGVAVLSVGAAVLLAAAVWYAVRHRKMARRLSWRGLLGGLVVFSAALLCNGVFGKNYSFKNLMFAALMVFSLLAFYLLFALFAEFGTDGNDYLMYCLVVYAMLICAQLFFAFATGRAVLSQKGSIVLGWGVWTSIGGMLVFLMPACFYFAASKRRYFGWLLGLVAYFGIVLSQSRGALLVGTVSLLLCIGGLCFFGDFKKENRIIAIAVAVLGVFCLFFFHEKLLSLVQNFINTGFDDNGRLNMWNIALQNFKEHPLFGSGFYDSYVTEEWGRTVEPYLYHNTVLQLLGATGIVGFAAYLYHRYTTVKLLLKRPNRARFFYAVCLFGLLTFSLLDVLFFKVYPTIVYSLILFFAEYSEKELPESPEAVFRI